MFANFVYLLMLALASPWILYRVIAHGRYRRGGRQKLWGLSPSDAERLRGDDRPCIWFHAVSVGEVNLLSSLVPEVQDALPQFRLLVSTSTDTGFDLAVDRFGADRVFFCPLDFSWAVKSTIRRLRPRMLVLTELELWPNLIRCSERLGVPVAVINGRLSATSARRYQQFGWFLKPTFHRIDWLGAQDETAARRFRDCGCSDVDVTGSLKFDGAPDNRDDPRVLALADWAGVAPWQRVWCVGSTQAGEEAMALAVFQDLAPEHPELRFILVPRHQQRFDEVAQLIEDSGLSLRRRSRSADAVSNAWDADTVILVDTIGELRQWWGVSQIATVGGSFGDRGGQNMLEPAGYGCAVSFGPNTKNFAAIAGGLLDVQGAVRVQDESELNQFVRRCLDDVPSADRLGINARRYVAQHQGATGRTVDAVKRLLQRQAG
ncbi:3-deoxy-D-manno-octulosonic acid transferase [Crateriforma conspicua]|uniref:3-deoxy-D-manno-octulosonic acid transferase n=1 Tax=Crateriforma conspicua TaxID=2527996 RepID=A0A5C6FPB8_9PLAN|nr:3-deoxy-D-manno-octulosonic acid transferase [Crateriforma conspicua]TWU63124.1 3-deoxy-D-manno-octulosonic acid transferase [Crateriforma conspicua]